jgi:hypothetical protein
MELCENFSKLCFLNLNFVPNETEYKIELLNDQDKTLQFDITPE